jgi:hypothetical protein
MRGAAGVQHGSHINNSLQSSIFFLKRKMQQNPCGKCCRERDLQRKRPKNRKISETKNAEINNIVYMELYSGPKRVNEKDLKTKYLRSKNREFTVIQM